MLFVEVSNWYVIFSLIFEDEYSVIYPVISISECNIIFCVLLSDSIILVDSTLNFDFCFSVILSDEDIFIVPSFESEIISLILSVLIFISDIFSLLSVDSIFSVFPEINSLLS